MAPITALRCVKHIRGHHRDADGQLLAEVYSGAVEAAAGQTNSWTHRLLAFRPQFEWEEPSKGA